LEIYHYPNRIYEQDIAATADQPRRGAGTLGRLIEIGIVIETRQALIIPASLFLLQGERVPYQQ